jgi:uncharacterized iron-regulated protein
MYSKSLKLFLAGIVLTLQAACMAPGFLKHTNPRGPLEGLKVGDIVKTSTGEVITYDSLMAELAHAKVIYVVESHTSAEDHRVQLRIMRGLYSQNPSLILALEMFPREAQPLLDEYAKGSLSEEEFLKEVKWDKIWGYPFQLYRDILTWAKDHRIEIVGLNAPGMIVRKIARSGLSSLTASERERVAQDFHTNDPAHQEYIRRQYHQHLKDNITDFNTFYEAQLAWEETMAETLAQVMASHVPEEQIIVLVGKGHISDRVGLPELTIKRMEHTYRTIAPIPVDYPGSTADPRIADFVWITDSSQPGHRVRLGAKFRQLPSGKGLEILDVLPDSPAAKAGIKNGDVLYRVDGKPINNIEEVRRAFSNKMVHELTLKRGDRAFSVTVTFR